MKKAFLWIPVFLMVGVLLFGCNTVPETETPGQTAEDTREIATALVREFGTKLQAVSLQAPAEDLERSMRENYGSMVSPDLLDAWLQDPLQAPGRLTSSPWPDRIEIRDAKELSAQEYQITGEIMEITSAEKASGGFAARRPAVFKVAKTADDWLITAVSLGPYLEPDSQVYANTEYGFNFYLPESWKGYTIITESWEGFVVNSSPPNAEQKETGPLLTIRHPLWTKDNPRQDIPIMIFTLSQWDMVQKEGLSVSAAPMGPSELGRNSAYVFALPARYNYAFPTGFEEVEDIIQSKPLMAY
jgi:hypothetical protein